MKAVARWFAPSLLRRVVFALMLAFLLVWAVLVALDVVTFRSAVSRKAALRPAAEVLVGTLAGVDPAGVALIVRSAEVQFNASRRDMGLDHIGELLFRAAFRDGRVAYASERFAGQALDPAASPDEPVVVGGEAYEWIAVESGGWTVWLLEPVVSLSTLLRWVSAATLTPLLIAFPLVLLPVWLAVRRGLLPLRRLAAEVAARDARDVSPLVSVPRHAELRPIAEALDALLARARDGIARERAFVQDAAHELRTPLAVICAEAHRVAGASTEAERQGARDALDRAASRASHLVHQLLTLARLESSPAPARPAHLDLVEVLRQVLIDAAGEAAERGVELSLDSPDRLVRAVDDGAVRSIAENLVRNGVRYAGRGARLVVSIREAGGELEFRVSDDGPGIAAGDVPRLFERFERGADAVEPGTGLGLAIVREAAHRLGGHVTHGPGLDGRGAGFEVRWPG